MNILIAPDKFKGSLTAREVCTAIKQGLLKANPELTVQMQPLADGGDGSLDILQQYLELEEIEIETVDPLGRALSAKYYVQEEEAYVELASASGLVLLNDHERNPLKTSTFGTGLMIADALRRGYNKIFLFVGGSATNDAATGLACALGFIFFDQDGKPLKPIGENLINIHSIEHPPDLNLDSFKIIVLCDVKNPLAGPHGAAHVYAQQKGASPKEINFLDNGLGQFSKIINQFSGREIYDLPGAGAAGGVSGGLVGLLDASLQNGFEVISKMTNLEGKIKSADFVISGEGRLDLQSMVGKVTGGIHQLCQVHHKKLFLLVGQSDLNHLSNTQIFSIQGLAQNVPDAMENAAEYLAKLASNISFLI